MTVLNDGTIIPASHCFSVADMLIYPSCAPFTEGLCCANDTIQNNIDRAVELVERITGMTLCPHEGCKEFSGNGDSILFFNPKTTEKLVTVTSVTTTDCSACSFSNPTTTPTNYGTKLEFCDCSDTFPIGHNNIKVCGQWATYDTIPDNMYYIIYTLALEFSEPGITGLTSEDGYLKKVEWDDFKIEYNNSDIHLTGLTTGYSKIDRMIEALVPTRNKVKFGTIQGNNKNTKYCSTHNTKGCNQC